MKSKLIWRPFKYYMLISIIVLCMVGLYLYFALENFITSQAANTLETRARLIILEIEDVELTAANQDRLQMFAQKASTVSQSRVSIIAADGMSLGESAQPQDPLSRPEIIGALKGEVTFDLRVGRCKQDVFYVAVPIIDDNGNVAGIVSVAKNLSYFSSKRNVIAIQFYGFIVVLFLFLTFLSYFFSRQYSKPIKYIYKKAYKLATGDFDARIDTSKTADLTVLAESFNYMAETIQKRMGIIVSQSNNLNAILNSMTDAVIAVDTDENIIDVNPAALNWLDLPRDEVEGRPMQQVIRHKALQNFVHEAVRNSSPKDADITIFLDNEHVLNAKSSPIYDTNNNMNGCVVVFYDVTKIRHLENLRRDFVSNVSHEIRTPLTVIKGSTEILRQSLENDEESTRFLEIINKHTERLAALINDLLLLSRIEQDTTELAREPQLLIAIVNKALNALEPKIEERAVIIMLDCPPDLLVKVNGNLIEQALINLIDNAVKYSDPGNPVEIMADSDDKFCRISVRDCGPGIDRKHFDRLFERFYRVDEARSRKVGGTGLGLAIVKHIVRAHHGNVEIVSEPGVGTCFTIVLPLD